MSKFLQSKFYKYFKYFANGVVCIFLVLLTALSVYSVYSTVSSDGELTMIGGSAAAVVLTGSMGDYPAAGDIVIIKEQDIYEVGDIITFNLNGMTVTHRIIAIDGDIVTTQGDSNNTADDSILISDIYGKVTAVIPKLGYVIAAAQQPNFIAAVISFILLFGVVYYAVEAIKKYKRGSQTSQTDTQTPTTATDVQDEIAKIKEEIEKLKSNKKDE